MVCMSQQKVIINKLKAAIEKDIALLCWHVMMMIFMIPQAMKKQMRISLIKRELEMS